MTGREEHAEKIVDRIVSLDQSLLEPEQLARLNRRHFQGALVRSGACVFMWLAALIAYQFSVINTLNFVGVSASELFLILMNPPTLWILRRIKKKTTYERFSILINLLEIVAYTAIIYFLGGVFALYLSSILAALITYTGVVGPPRLPYLIATACAFSLILMVTIEHLAIIPHMHPILTTPLPWSDQAWTVVTTVALLYVVAFTSSYTSSLRRKHRATLREQNTELGQSRASLETAAQKIEQQNFELRAALAKARESDRMKSEFLANMSHELRTPLNHIIGFTELLIDKNFGELNETQAEYLNDIDGSGKHLLSLINDILDLSKVEAGKMELELSEINLKMLLENSLMMVREKAMKHRIQLTRDANGLPERIRGGERLLKQIMYNLLSNAVKFTPDGGSVHLTAGWEDGMADGKKWIRVTVADTGIGIKEEDLQRIFEPFEQVDNSVSRKYQGTGLGLSLARRFVELHGGKIWAESEGGGNGSRFHFIIPAHFQEDVHQEKPHRMSREGDSDGR